MAVMGGCEAFGNWDLTNAAALKVGLTSHSSAGLSMSLASRPFFGLHDNEPVIKLSLSKETERVTAGNVRATMCSLPVVLADPSCPFPFLVYSGRLATSGAGWWSCRQLPLWRWEEGCMGLGMVLVDCYLLSDCRGSGGSDAAAAVACHAIAVQVLHYCPLAALTPH